MINDHEKLQVDMSTHEKMASEQIALISDLVDIDRTSELLLWVFQSMWRKEEGKRDEEQRTEKPASPIILRIVRILP